MFREIPATVEKDQKVTVFEALHDLDFVGNDEEVLFAHGNRVGNSGVSESFLFVSRVMAGDDFGG